MEEKAMVEGDKKKWKPVHEICIAKLSESCVFVGELHHWAEIYANGAIVPSKNIPDLIKAFQRAQNTLKDQVEIREVASAIACLKEQLEERIAVGDLASFKQGVIDSCKHSTDPWDILIGRTSPKDEFEVLDIDSNGNAILKGWCVISDAVSTPIPINLKLLKKVVPKKSTCEIHGSIEHMQSATGLCPGCHES